MNNHDLEALIASLRDGARRGLAPREMMPLVDALGLPAQLVWEREAYDDRYHYDALIPTGDGTLSISFAPDGALPWPLRGVRRWSDGDLVRVNETLLRVLEAIRLFDFVWAQAPLTTALVNACLIHEAVAAERIEPTDEQLQSAFDAFRARRGLLTEADTAAWMESRGYSLEQLERAMVDEARVEALRDRVTAAHLDGFLATRLQELIWRCSRSSICRPATRRRGWPKTCARATPTSSRWRRAARARCKRDRAPTSCRSRGRSCAAIATSRTAVTYSLRSRATSSARCRSRKARAWFACSRSAPPASTATRALVPARCSSRVAGRAPPHRPYRVAVGRRLTQRSWAANSRRWLPRRARARR